MGAAARALGLFAACCLLGAVLARVAVSHYAKGAIGLAVGVPLLVFLAPRPLLASLALLSLLATVFPYGYLPHIALPGHPPLSVADVFLAVPVLGTIWRKPWRTWHPVVQRWFLIVAVLLALVAVVSVPVAAHGHAAARSSIVGFKNLAYLLFALTIALELSGRTWRRLLDAVILIAAAVAVMSIAARASSGLASFLNSINAQAVETATLTGGATAAKRVRLPGLFLVYGMIIPTLTLLLTSRDRWRYGRLLALVLMVTAVALSLNRNMYFGMLIGLVVTMLVGGPRLRYRLLLTLALLAATVVLVVESVKPSVTSEIGQRAGSALSTSVLSSSSAQDRAVEFRFALNSISLHPWTGVGWMQSYGLTIADLGVTGPAATGERVFVEDWYLHAATDYGIPVAVLFLLVPGSLLGYGVLRARTAADPGDRAMVGAMVGAVLALLLSCLVGTYLEAPDSMVSLGALCGMLLAASLRAAPLSSSRSPTLAGRSPGTPQSGDSPTLSRS